MRKSQNCPYFLRKPPPMHRSLTMKRASLSSRSSTHQQASILARILGKFYLPRCPQPREYRLVFSNRDFTSTLYSGMRASCATSADLSRPLPHYLVHAPRIDATTEKLLLSKRVYAPGLPHDEDDDDDVPPHVRQISSRSCLFPVDSSPIPRPYERTSGYILCLARVESVSSFENVPRGEIFAGTRLHRGFIRYPLTD